MLTRVPLARVLADIAGQRHDHDHAAVLGQPPEHAVGHVARMAVDRPRARMAEDHRRGRHVERILHGLLAHMAEIDQHAEAIHLAHHVAAEIGEAAMFRRVGRGIGPR